MRILKRNLAFMLAMIMALSLTAFAGYEDYPDVDELTYVEAVDVLTELGIVEGSNGKLLPTGNLTRAQAAKLIAYTMLGKKAADALQAEVAPFTDVPTYHWAAGYVEYCADAGIVGGNGDGTFAPEANVTASQYAKMLLCAVGYGEKGEFTGTTWDAEVNAQATKLGVFDNNLDVVFADAVTREEAFLYTFNALTKVMEVTYSADADEYYSGTVFNSIKGFDFEETLGAKLYDLKTKAATDVWGRESYNWYKGAKKIAGMYHEAPAAVYTAAVKSGTLFTDLDLDNSTKATWFDNGVEKTFQIKKNDKTSIGGNGVLIEAYVDEDLNVTLIQIDTYLAKVTDILDEDVTMTIYGHKVDSQTVETDMDLAEKQYVLVTLVDDEVQTIATLETVNGVLDAHGAKTSYTKMDGTKYSHSAHLAYEEDIDVNYAEAYKVKYDDAEMIMMFDEYGYMIGLQPVSEAEKMDGYVLVTDSEVQAGGLASADKALVEVLNLDGTGYDVLNLQTKRVKENGVRVTKYLDAEGNWQEIDADKSDMIAYGFYGYYMTEDGEIVLKALSETSAKEIEALAKNGGSITANGKQEIKISGDEMDLVLDNDTVMNLVTDKAVETLEGYKNIKIDEKDLDILVIYKGRIVEEIYVVDGNLVDKDLYAYYNDDEFEVSGSKTYMPLYMDGELKWFTYAGTKLEGNDIVAKKKIPVGLYKINLEGSKIVAIEPVKDALTGKVESTASNGKYFEVDTSAEYVVYADGVKVFDMTKDGVEIEKVVKGDTILYIETEEEKADVATHIWVLKHNKKEAQVGGDVIDYTLNVEAEGNVATITVEGVLEAEDGVYVMMWKDGKYSNVGYAKYVEGTAYTYTFENNYSDDYEFAFLLMVDGETLLTKTVAVAAAK